MKTTFKRIMPCLALFFLSMSSLVSHAAVFSITPQATLPTSVPLGGSVKAYYNVTNTTGGFHSGNYVKYLPPNVSQVTVDGTIHNLCGATFPLTASASCTLELNITGAVNAYDPNPQHHLFVCLGGCTTCCAGTNFSLDVAVSNSSIINDSLSSNASGTPTITTTNTSSIFYIVYSQNGSGANTLSANLPSGMSLSGPSSCNLSQSTPTCSLAVNAGTTTGSFTITPTVTSGTASAPSPLPITVISQGPTTTAVLSSSSSGTPILTSTSVTTNFYIVYSQTGTGTTTLSATLPGNATMSFVNGNSCQVTNTSTCSIEVNAGTTYGSGFIITPTVTQGSATPPGTLSINIVQAFAYVTQANDGPPLYSVMKCPIDINTGLLIGTECVSADDGLSSLVPQGIAISNDGSTAYITTYNTSYVYQCSINSATGQFETCTPTPQDNYTNAGGFIALNSTNSTAYLPSNGYHISTCQVNAGTISNCGQSSNQYPALYDPAGIAINSANTVAFLGDTDGDAYVGTCDLTSNPPYTCTPKSGGGGANPITFPGYTSAGVALNNNNNTVYITNTYSKTVYGCDATSPVGNPTFNSCFPAYSNLATAPYAIALNAANTMAYITDEGANVYACSINQNDGRFTTCIATEFTFSQATDIALGKVNL